MDQQGKMISKPPGEYKESKESKGGKESKVEEKYHNYAAKNPKIHWLIVIIAVFITFSLSYVNEVSIFECLRRSFYAGVIFWLAAEVIDFFLTR